MKKHIHHDVFIGAILLVFCAIFLTTSRNFPDLSGVFPQFFLSVLVVLSAVVLYRGIKETLRASALRAKGEEVRSALALKQLALPMQGILFIFLYTLGIQYVGFFVSTTVFTVLFMLFLGIRNWRHIVFSTIGMDLFLYFLFVRQLKLSLPAGFLV